MILVPSDNRILIVTAPFQLYRRPIKAIHLAIVTAGLSCITYAFIGVAETQNYYFRLFSWKNDLLSIV